MIKKSAAELRARQRQQLLKNRALDSLIKAQMVIEAKKLRAWERRGKLRQQVAADADRLGLKGRARSAYCGGRMRLLTDPKMQSRAGKARWEHVSAEERRAYTVALGRTSWQKRKAAGIKPFSRSSDRHLTNKPAAD